MLAAPCRPSPCAPQHATRQSLARHHLRRSLLVFRFVRLALSLLPVFAFHGARADFEAPKIYRSGNGFGYGYGDTPLESCLQAARVRNFELAVYRSPNQGVGCLGDDVNPVRFPYGRCVRARLASYVQGPCENGRNGLERNGTESGEVELLRPCPPNSRGVPGPIRLCRCDAGFSEYLGQCIAGVAPSKNKGKAITPACSNPCNAGRGNKVEVLALYLGAGEFPLELRLTYNSPLVSDQADYSPQAYGRHWHSNLALRVLPLDSLGNRLAALRPDGRSVEFRRVGDTTQFRSDPDVPDRIAELHDSAGVLLGWRYYDSNSDVEEDYDAGGRLVLRRNRAGLVQTLYYDTVSPLVGVVPLTGVLSSVRDAEGRRLDFAYDGAGRVRRITDPAGELIQLSYSSADNLSEISFQDSSTRHYHYGEASHGAAELPNHLTGLTDESGTRLANWHYDAQGRAIIAEHAGGSGRVEFQFNTDGSTAVTDVYGEIRNLSFAEQHGVRIPTQIDGAPAPRYGPRSQSYDANGYRQSETDHNGNQTCYRHDSVGRETERIEGLPSNAACPYTAPLIAPQRKITTTWHPEFRLATQIAEPLRRTTYSIHPDGNLCGARGAVCERTVQATSDGDGSQGINATPVGLPRTWRTTYNARGQVLTEDGPREDVADLTTYTYHPEDDPDLGRRGQLASITNALGHRTELPDYAPHGRPLRLIDANGLTTELAYDPRGRLIERNAGGERTEYHYHPTGHLAELITPDGARTRFAYDSAQRLIGITDAVGNQRRFTLDAAGNRITEEVFDPTGTLVHEGHRTFDALGRLASEVDAFNHSTEHRYDAQGNRTEVIDPLGRLTRTRYDALLRANEIEQPNPNGAGTLGRIRTTFDAQDQIRALTDPLGLATVYSVDGLGNPTEEHSPDRGRISQSFDTAGNPLSRTDARGISATHRYDALNRLVETRYPDQLIQYHYDAGEHGVGRLTRLTDQTGETRWRYDRHGRVIERRHTSAFASLTTNYHYDAFGRMSGMTYPSGLEVDYDLDPMGRIRAIRANGQPIATDIDYHPWGIPTTWRWADGSVQRRELDPAGRIVRFTLGDRTHELSYNPAGEIIGQSDGGTFQQSYAYDGLSRLTSFIDTATTQSFSYDLNGNRQTKHLGASQTTYQYAPGSNRLSASSGSETKNYAYTAAGDLERMSTGGTSYRWTYGGDGRMKFLSKTNEPAYFYYFNALGERTLKAGSSYAYDEAGHLIGDYMLGGTLGREILWLGDLPIAVIQARPEEAPHDSPTRTGTWTLAKQPLGASLGSFYRNDPGTGAATAQWAIPQTIAGRYRLYARWVEAPSHSAAARYTVIHAEGTNVISADQRQNGGRWYLLGTFNFTPGANHRVVLTDAPDGAVIADAIKVVLDNLEPSIGNIHTDHLGTPRLIEDHSGKTIWRWDHLNPFGANPANEDPDGDGVKVVFNLRFPGQVFDKETGMHYNYFRDYDSATGRYLQADPIGLAGGINPYLYAEANPVSWTDPLGLKTMQCTKPLNALGPKWGPVGYKYGPLLYHQYSCVVDKNGKVTCGGQDRGENGEGKPSNDVLNPPGGKCKETQPDNDCFEQCLITEWAKPRPKYGIPFGTDCQEYDDDVNARCRKQCKIKK